MSKVVRARYEKGVLKPLEPLEFREGEEVEIIIKHRMFEEKDYRELVDYLASFPKGKGELLDMVQELYLEEALR
ncbi:MAG: antitoxin family protein [Desulfurococcales archaeon]|nr:antitoxin family protein [Desulfurococcales archaeon]